MQIMAHESVSLNLGKYQAYIFYKASNSNL